MKRLFLDTNHHSKRQGFCCFETSCNDSIGVSCFIITENENILFA